MTETILQEACEALESRLQTWWETRKHGGTLRSNELTSQFNRFLDDNPDYRVYERDIDPYYKLVPGSYGRANPCCTEGCCNPLYDHAKVNGVGVRPFDWENARRLALTPVSDMLKHKPWLKPNRS